MLVRKDRLVEPVASVQGPDLQTRRAEPVRRANRAIVGSWKERLRRVRPYAIDAGLAVVVAVAVTNAINVSSYSGPDTRPPDALAYALGVTIGVLLLGRRRW